MTNPHLFTNRSIKLETVHEQYQRMINNDNKGRSLLYSYNRDFFSIGVFHFQFMDFDRSSRRSATSSSDFKTIRITRPISKLINIRKYINSGII